MRVLSCIQPTGDIHLGNYLGALRHWTSMQTDRECFFGAVDLHALTIPRDPNDLADRITSCFATLIATGIDPDRSVLFQQSRIPAHSELGWVMQCMASIGELNRMTQFKEKSERDFVSAGLLAYPALMAADILLYQADAVPVGEDQRQHLELTRDVAQRFNARYGEVFRIPEAEISVVAARVMSLQNPRKKMSKSIDDELGCILLTDSNDEISRKVRRAVTDSENEVRYDVDLKPGVSNLLSILSAATARSIAELESEIVGYSDLKASVADALIECLAPIREKRRDLLEDQARLQELIVEGSNRAKEIADETLLRAFAALGLSK